jgi:endonuclease/exonuclease/phosphatase family metal-dependent hydrolase
VLAGCDPPINYLDPAGPRFAGDHAGPAPPAPDSLLVVTYNLKVSREVDRAIAVLTAPPFAGADILLMQEMDAGACERIAAALGLRYVLYPASAGGDGHGFGPAVLTRHPMRADHKVLLPHAEPLNGRRRTATAAVLEIGGRPLHVWSVHSAVLALGLSLRLEQAQTVIDDAAKVDGPVLVGGDFNSADPDAARQTVELFAAHGLAWASAGAGDTLKRFGVWFLLDFVFARGLAAREAGVYRGDAGSDHQPVWARLAAPAGAP